MSHFALTHVPLCAVPAIKPKRLGPGQGFVFHAKNVFADVGPELFEDVGAVGDDGLGGPCGRRW
jgi:hypothetical protein